MIEYFGYPLSSEYDRATVIVKNLDNAFMGTWNHKGRHIRVSQPVFCDYNHDGVTEIFSFHRHLDSIFLNGINPDSSDVFFIQSRFIDTTRWVNNTVNLRVLGLGHEDYNNDNYEDIVFQIDGGFSLQPRNTYVYDIKNDTLLKSPRSFARLTYPYGIIFDIDKDGNKEVILSTHASENIRDFTLPFHDYSVYVMVLDERLQFIEKPYEIKGSMAHIRAYPLVQDESNRISIHYHNFGDRFTDSLFLFNSKAQLEKVICLDSIINTHDAPVSLRFHLDKGDYNYLKKPTIGLKNGTIIRFDNNLKIHQQIETRIKGLNHAIPLELNNDTSNTEYFILSNTEALFVNKDFKILAKPKVNFTAIRNFGRISSKNNPEHTFYFQCKDNVHHLVFKTNPWFQHSWILIMIVTVVFWMFIVTIKSIISYINRTQMMGILKERDTHKTQLARELHDELGSKITGLRLMLENLETGDSKNEISKVSDHLQKTHQEIRNIIYNLAPPHLKNKSFSLTIKQLIETFDNVSDMKFRLEFVPNDTILEGIDDTIKMELFRILQESLNNTLKHSMAQKVIIQFMMQELYLEVFIEDDGIGFDMKTIKTGQGLISMEARAKMIKGYLSLYSEKEKGTSIALQVPIKSKKSKNGLFNFINRRP
jgi:hypothetical protein